jgi:hypothetical protein
MTDRSCMCVNSVIVRIHRSCSSGPLRPPMHANGAQLPGPRVQVRGHAPWAPLRARTAAVAVPMPLVGPVTTAVRPDTSPAMPSAVCRSRMVHFCDRGGGAGGEGGLIDGGCMQQSSARRVFRWVCPLALAPAASGPTHS